MSCKSALADFVIRGGNGGKEIPEVGRCFFADCPVLQQEDLRRTLLLEDGSKE